MDVDAYELLKVEKRSGPRILLPDSVQTDVRTAGAYRERAPGRSPAFALQSPVFQVTFLHAQMMPKLVKVSGNHQLGEFIAILAALLLDCG
jgi:hypothetical protein